MLKDLPQNTRVTLLLNLFSSTMASILFFYATLYMQGVGLTAPQIGLIASLASVTGFLTQAMAAPVVCHDDGDVHLFRHGRLTESEAGGEQQGRHGSLSLVASVWHHIETVRQNLANREFRSLSALFSIPAGYVAGTLYAYRPGLAILVTGVLTFAAVLPLLRKAAIPVPDPAG